ncbi:MAG: zinc ABC transporter substrate-binding protein [Clostridia bacterium]|nr:zinc ABC transporter substrate-binding protein [Clostridia bacterium]
MKKFMILLLALLVLPGLALCETIVTSFYPIWIMTLNLTSGLEDHVTVRNLAAPTVGCLHDYQLQPADMKALTAADAFLINGAGMEAFLPEITRSLPDLPIVEASEGIELLENGSAVEILEAEEEGETNSHIWLDPLRAVRMAENLAAGLIRVLPGDEAVITANLADYRVRLEALDARLRQGLGDLSRKDIVTFHEAFPYFAAAYGLNVVAVVNKEPGEVLTPAQLGELVREIRLLGNPPLFVEPQYTDLSAQTLSSETGAPVYSLDPIVTGPEENVPPDYYETVMLQNMNTLITALSGNIN